jgi:hypothetical protein
MDNFNSSFRSSTFGMALTLASFGSLAQDARSLHAQDTDSHRAVPADKSGTAVPELSISKAHDLQIHLPTFNIVGKLYSNGFLANARANRVTYEGNGIVDAISDITSPNFLSVSLSEKNKMLDKALAALTELKMSTAAPVRESATALRDAIQNVESLRELLNHPNFLSLDPAHQELILQVIAKLGTALEKDDSIHELASSRESAKLVAGWLFDIVHGVASDTPFLLAEDLNGRNALEHISRLLHEKSTPSEILLALDLVNDLKSPEMSSFQTSYPHCPTAGLHSAVISRTPGEYARQVVELFVDGETRFRSGMTCTLDTEAIKESHLKRRSSSASIFQSSLMTYAAGDSPNRSATDLQVGLNIPQVASLASDYFGKSYIVVSGGGYPVWVMLKGKSSFPVFGALQLKSTDGQAVGHFITFTSISEDRVFFRDSNGNYGLHAHGWDITKAMAGERPKWHWGDCTEAGENPLPANVIPILAPGRTGTPEIMFGSAVEDNSAGSSPIPIPGFELKEPTRRMEDWNSGEFSMTLKEALSANPLVFFPKEEFDLLASKVQKPSQRSWTSVAIIGAATSLAVYGFLHFLGRRGGKQ